MTQPQLYSLILGVIIILHRIPGAFAPKSFRDWYTCFSYRSGLMRLTGLILALFIIWGIYVVVAQYQSPGWFIIGLSLFILYKAVLYMFIPRSAAVWDHDANNQPDRIISILSALIILGGGLVLMVGLVLMRP